MPPDPIACLELPDEKNRSYCRVDLRSSGGGSRAIIRAAERKVRRKQGNPRLIELSNLGGSSDGCVKRGPFIGTLVQRKFDDDEITLIGFVVRDAKDERTYINLDDEQIDRMLMVDRGYLSSFLARGRRLKVWAFACGAAGRVLYADRIVAL